MNRVQKFYDNIFGNRDGKFTAKDLPNHSVLIVGIVVDLVMLLAEYRVYSVGLQLTKSQLLALGFVMVSSLPFYLGQVAFLYNRANKRQLWIAGFMVVMGLLVSAYYGFADLILQTDSYIQVTLGVGRIDVDTLYLVAVVCTVALVVCGLLYVFFDDSFANNLKSNRIQGQAKIATEEIQIKRQLLADLTALRADEEALKSQYPEDWEALSVQFQSNKNPTGGNGKR